MARGAARRLEALNALGQFSETVRLGEDFQDDLFASASVAYEIGFAWNRLGRARKARAAYKEALRLDPTGFEGDAIKVPAAGVTLARQYYLYAKLLAARGETEKALEYLVKAHAAGFTDFGKVEGDRDFATLVADPRYAALK